MLVSFFKLSLSGDAKIVTAIASTGTAVEIIQRHLIWFQTRATFFNKNIVSVDFKER